MAPPDTGMSPEAGSHAIIRRKLASPTLGDRLVMRDRVTSRIREKLGRANVLAVYAAAGAGKTTAVAGALQGMNRPIAWVSLDGTESAAGRLLLYLEAAVAPHAPDACGVATDALAAGIPIGEAAGLLAESLHGTGLILVCDNAERIVDSGQALTVLSALARYVPRDVALVLISRTALPLDTGSTGEIDRVADVTGSDLAFDMHEAAEAMRLIGRPTGDAAEVVRATGGWVAGVLFAPSAAGAPTPDRLREYLTTHVLSGLYEEERRFLVHTSLLDEVTLDDALALDFEDAPRIMASLRHRHLPVTWSEAGTLTVSPQLRDHLQELLAQEDPRLVRRLRHEYARLLLKRGEREEAVQALLCVGAVEEAWAQAAELLPHLIERMDFGPAARWLDALQASARSPSPEIGAVVLRVAFALEQAGRGVELLTRHGWQWVNDLAADERDGGEALVLLTWCLWHSGRLDEAGQVVDRLPAGRARDIALALLAQSRDEPPRPFPEFATTPSGPLDGLLMRMAYTRGLLAGLDDPGTYGPWRSILGAPWVIAALRVTGRIDQAMALYEAHCDAPQPLWLHALDAAELMLDLGRGEDAWRALQRGRSLVTATGSEIYTVLIQLMEAKVCLRLHRDPEAAHRALDEAEANGAGQHAFTRELSLLWRGLAFLLRHRYSEARDVLGRCVRSMRGADRMLEIPTAACYLAEAQWRLGEEDASDESAALALAVADERGSVHLLLTALSDVPAVAVRGADTQTTRMSRWHELTALLANGRRITAAGQSPRLVLEDLGEPELWLDNEAATPRLRKSIELLAYLLATPDREASRRELLEALFESRNEAAGRSYLRQALYRLRGVLPGELSPTLQGDRFRLPGPDLVGSRAADVLAAFTEADHQDEDNRLETLTVALARTERGRYLEGISGVWVESRRADIDERILRARLDLAKVAFRLGRYREASTNVDTVLRADPYREQAWLLRLTLAQASGNDDHVLALYQRYVATMRELDLPPSAEVRRLVTRLRA